MVINAKLIIKITFKYFTHIFMRDFYCKHATTKCQINACNDETMIHNFNRIYFKYHSNAQNGLTA